MNVLFIQLWGTYVCLHSVVIIIIIIIINVIYMAQIQIMLSLLCLEQR